jgi:hypothetical protein
LSVGLFCFAATLIVPFALSYVAWPDRNLSDRTCWLAQKVFTNSYSLWSIVSNLILAPVIETLPLLLVYKFLGRGVVPGLLVYFFGFIIHGLAVVSFGKGLAFLSIYSFSADRVRTSESLRSWFYRATVIHVIWNAVGMGFSLNAIKLC